MRHPDMPLTRLLHPQRFPGMSGKMAAIVGYVLGERWSAPEISGLTITSDGFVLAAHRGDIGANDFLGPAADLERNWIALLDAANLTDAQRTEAESAYRMAVAA